MEISEIKQKLPISHVLDHYNHQPDRNNMLRCPFHDDKTASLKIYTSTNSFHCFGCGKSGDHLFSALQHPKNFLAQFRIAPSAVYPSLIVLF